MYRNNPNMKVPSFWYIKRNDDMSWFDFIRASIDDFRKKHDYFPVYISMNHLDKKEVLGKAKGVYYHGIHFKVETPKTALKLHLELHY